MIVRVARISGDVEHAMSESVRRRRPAGLVKLVLVLTDREVCEGLVDGEDVARRVVRELFWWLQVVVRDDVVARVDALRARVSSHCLTAAPRAES